MTASGIGCRSMLLSSPEQEPDNKWTRFWIRWTQLWKAKGRSNPTATTTG
jgi:hypothetical protein